MAESRFTHRRSFAGNVLSHLSAVGGRRHAYRERMATAESKDPEEEEAEQGGNPGNQWVSRLLERVKNGFSYASLPAKAGLSAAICSLICFVPGYLSVLSKNGSWAVVTADVVMEASVGLTLKKGINRTLGTLAAATAALLVNYAAAQMGRYEAGFLVFWVFVGTVLCTMFKFRPPFKDRWNYMVVMCLITFHILLLSKTDGKDVIKLPLIRLVTIVIGFVVASAINVGVAPEYAGTAINELVAKNLERAGNVMELCVTAYREGKVLDQMPEILAGKLGDDNIHVSFHEIVAADSGVEKLMSAVPFEPRHGKFFCGYPWEMYPRILSILRYTVYDVAALDSCLRAEIQAPMHLRLIYEEEFQMIARECGEVFRMLGASIRDMRHVHCAEAMDRAEEGALLLQHKTVMYTSEVLRGGVLGVSGRHHLETISEPEKKHEESYEENTAFFEEAINELSSPPVQFEAPVHHGTQLDPKSKVRLSDRHREFLQRRESMGRHWDTTVDRIAALSLIKFASLLIELVAKAKYVVNIVDELEIKARFEEVEDSAVTPPKLKAEDRPLY